MKIKINRLFTEDSSENICEIVNVPWDFTFKLNRVESERERGNEIKSALKFVYDTLQYYFHNTVCVFGTHIEYNSERYLSGIIVLMNVILLNRIYRFFFSMSRNAINRTAFKFELDEIG